MHCRFHYRAGQMNYPNGLQCTQRKCMPIDLHRMNWIGNGDRAHRLKFVFITVAWAVAFQLFHQWPFHSICMQ